MAKRVKIGNRFYDIKVDPKCDPSEIGASMGFVEVPESIYKQLQFVFIDQDQDWVNIKTDNLKNQSKFAPVIWNRSKLYYEIVGADVSLQ